MIHNSHPDSLYNALHTLLKWGKIASINLNIIAVFLRPEMQKTELLS